ncbi:hypothetical protein [uncultured Clostridium sp.]|uniref:hypothetical protein n=1 Tax=uncultured Clostridium sp. TaxID=59620 RepID=UPI0026F4072B|nr:hypothetical protein [uncultured Clostridium sp.]
MAILSNSFKYEVNDLKKRLIQEKVNLDFAKENNNKIIKYKKEYEDALAVKEEYDQYIKALDLYYKLCIRESNNYKNKRLDYLCSFIDDKLYLIFPDEDFKSKIVTENVGSIRKTYLELHKQDSGEIEIPETCQGKLCQQLLSFSASTALVKSLGMNRLFLDEAFSASAPKNLTKIGSILKTMVDDGMQIILIEQEQEIYKDLPRREIYVEKDSLEDKTKIIYEKDF